MNKTEENILREISELKNKLTSNNSDIGDWKIIKCYEANLSGKELPYDLSYLLSERQNARDRINQLEIAMENINQTVGDQ